MFGKLVLFTTLSLVYSNPISVRISGCEGTQFGCCSDGMTPCNTTKCGNCLLKFGGCEGTQFGCCSDGMTPCNTTKCSNCIDL